MRRAAVSHCLSESNLGRFRDDAKHIAREADEALLRKLSETVRQVAITEVMPDRLGPFGSVTTLRLVTVDMPAYLSWADSNGLKPFLTPHGFDFKPL